MPDGLGEDEAVVPSAERPQLVRHLLDGFRVVGVTLVDGPPQLLLHRRKDAVPVEASDDPGPPLEVAIERWVRPLPDDVLAAVEGIHQVAFGEAPGRIYPWLQERPGATCFVARHEGRVVGFKFGAELAPARHHSHEGGVLPAVRRRGVARTLMEAQHAWARSWGAKAITTNTMNDFLPMLLLNLSVGFEVRGVEAVGDQVKLRLWKRLGPE